MNNPFYLSSRKAPGLASLVLVLLLGSFGLSAQTASQRFTLSGYVSDAETGERLIGATVLDRASGLGTVTNTYGFYSLTVPADTLRLYVAYIGYQPEQTGIVLRANQTLNVKITPNATLQEVEIKADRYERIEERAQMSRIDVPIEQIKRVPALLGEVDVLKALQLLPGVSGGGEGQSGLYVRGGGPDQNLILLDGVPVYNASHLFGFFSVFNADAIKDVSLTKGGFPARYGGRLSSVIEINMKEGNENEFHGEGSVGIVASKLTLEGPIKKGRSSFIVSGRRTYIDLLTRPLIKRGFSSGGGSGNAGYYFYDYNAKVNYRFSDRDRLYLSFYSGRDKFYLGFEESFDENNLKQRFTTDAGLGWGNLTSALRWNHVLGPRLFANATATYSRYEFDTRTGTSTRLEVPGEPAAESEYDLQYLSGIDDWALKFDFDYVPAPDHLVKFGTGAILHTFRPGRFDTRIRNTINNENTALTLGQPNVQATELALYAEDDWKVTDRLRLNYGLHGSGFVVGKTSYWSLQPRFNGRYLLDGGYALKGAFSTMRQYIHLLTNETIGLPTDLWLPTTGRVRPQDSWQAAVGAAKTVGKDYEFSIEAYYKEMKNVIAFREGASLFQFNDWQSRVSQGDGTSYGFEFFIQKKTGRFSGWLGYTLSWAWRQFDDLNLGRQYPYKYDRRHDFEVVGSYKITPGIRVSATWVYGTGNAVTFGTSRYQVPNAGNPSNAPVEYTFVDTHTPERNNFRYAPYHRLDVGIDFTKQKRRHERTWSFGAYNAYNRKNPFYLFLQTRYDTQTGREKSTLKQASLFPVIPYINYSFKF